MDSWLTSKFPNSIDAICFLLCFFFNSFCGVSHERHQMPDGHYTVQKVKTRLIQFSNTDQNCLLFQTVKPTQIVSQKKTFASNKGAGTVLPPVYYQWVLLVKWLFGQMNLLLKIHKCNTIHATLCTITCAMAI